MFYMFFSCFLFQTTFRKQKCVRILNRMLHINMTFAICRLLCNNFYKSCVFTDCSGKQPLLCLACSFYDSRQLFVTTDDIWLLTGSATVSYQSFSRSWWKSDAMWGSQASVADFQYKSSALKGLSPNHTMQCMNKTCQFLMQSCKIVLSNTDVDPASIVQVRDRQSFVAKLKRMRTQYNYIIELLSCSF